MSLSFPFQVLTPRRHHDKLAEMQAGLRGSTSVPQIPNGTDSRTRSFRFKFKAYGFVSPDAFIEASTSGFAALTTFSYVTIQKQKGHYINVPPLKTQKLKCSRIHSGNSESRRMRAKHISRKLASHMGFEGNAALVDWQ